MNSDGTQHSRSPGQYLDEAMFRQLRHATKGEVRQAILIGNLVLAINKAVAYTHLIAQEWATMPPRITEYRYLRLDLDDTLRRCNG